MHTADFDYCLPAELIAQTPSARRDDSRLLTINRRDGVIRHERFVDLARHLQHGDVLVLNNSKVIPARLHGVKAKSQTAIEMLLLEETRTNDWWAMLRPGKRMRVGDQIQLRAADGSPSSRRAEVIE